MTTPVPILSPRSGPPEAIPDPPTGKRSSVSALKITLVYAFFAGAWIYFSDRALEALISDPQILLQWSVFKGLAFVAVTSSMLLFLIRRALVRAEAALDVARRKEEVATNERSFSEAMLESMPGVLYFYDHNGKFLRWNRNLEAVSGYSGEELKEMHPLDFFAQADKALVAERIARVFDGGEATVEAPMVMKDGSARQFFFTGRRVRFCGKDCLVGMGIDVSERKEAERALRKSEEQFRLIMDNLEDLVAVLDLEGRRIYNSPSYRSLLGDLEKLRGSNSFEQIHPDDKERVRRSFEDTVATGVGRRLEYRLVDRNGSPRYIESQGSVIRGRDGRVAQVVVVSRDITERREAEREIRELNASLEQRVAERTAELAVAKERAEAADRLKSAFLATMSHELRTPLNSIIGFTGIVLNGLAGPLNPEQEKQLGMVRSSARHLLELINDVLDISKIEAGEVELRFETVDLQASLEKCIAVVKPSADRKSLPISLNGPGDPVRIVSDRRRVEQILINLLNNAVKFTDAGRIDVAVGIVPASDQGASPSVRIQVKDTGIGIQGKDMACLFQPFRQVDSGLARRHDGTGLGLAICRRLAEMLGGGVAAESEFGKGSVFTVTLPMER